MTELEWIFQAQQALAERLLLRLPRAALAAQAGEAAAALPDTSGDVPPSPRQASPTPDDAENTTQTAFPTQEAAANTSVWAGEDTVFSPILSRLTGETADAVREGGTLLLSPQRQDGTSLDAWALSRAVERDARRYE